MKSPERPRLYLVVTPATTTADVMAAIDGGDVAAVELVLNGDALLRASPTLTPTLSRLAGEGGTRRPQGGGRVREERVGASDESTATPMDLESVAALISAVQARGVAVLLRDRMDLVVTLGADGVYLSAPDADVPAARRALGRELTLGACAGASRHRAMVAGEAGADFVAFGPLFGADGIGTGIVHWWTETMVLPSLARGGITHATIPDAVAAGADFIAVGRAVWDDPRGPAVAIAALNRAVDTAWAS